MIITMRYTFPFRNVPYGRRHGKEHSAAAGLNPDGAQLLFLSAPPERDAERAIITISNSYPVQMTITMH